MFRGEDALSRTGGILASPVEMRHVYHRHPCLPPKSAPLQFCRKAGPHKLLRFSLSLSLSAPPFVFLSFFFFSFFFFFFFFTLHCQGEVDSPGIHSQIKGGMRKSHTAQNLRRIIAQPPHAASD